VDVNLSNDALGLILLGLTVLLLLIGWNLAQKGLAKAEDAAEAAKDAAAGAKEMVRAAQPVLAGTSDARADELAQTNRDLIGEFASIDKGLSGLNDALAELKGVFAPARVFVAFAAVSFIASLIAFGLVDVQVSSGDNEPEAAFAVRAG
jgi:hypothetical protein